ncbi:MAG: PDZ domain-containing protein [Acidobacteriota bacterium]
MNRIVTVIALGAALGPWSVQAATVTGVRRVPIDVVSGGRIFLQARVNGSDPLWFLLDTGSPRSYLDPGQIRPLGLRNAEKAEKGSGAVLDRNALVEIAGLQLAEHPFTVAPVRLPVAHPVSGILGAPFFRQLVVAIDYAASSAVLSEPRGFRYSGSGTSVALDLSQGVPVIGARLTVGSRGPFTARLRVDTGAYWPLRIERAFARTKQLLATTAGMHRFKASGTDGAEEGFLAGRARLLQVGPFLFRDEVATFPEAQPGTRVAWDGILGSALLNRFRVTFDYSRRQMFLEPTEMVGLSFDYDLAGVTVVPEGKGFKVGSVQKDTPGGGAGLEVGDVILAMDDRPVAGMSLLQVRQLFRQDGEKHTVEIQRGRDRFLVQMTTMRIR